MMTEDEARERHIEEQRAQEAELQRAHEARVAERRAVEESQLKRTYRANFSGTDAQFEQVWPGILARLAENKAQRRIKTL